MRRVRVRNSRSMDDGLYVPAEEIPGIRERAFRRALEHAGYLPTSIDLAVKEERAYFERERVECKRCLGRREAWES